MKVLKDQLEIILQMQEERNNLSFSYVDQKFMTRKIDIVWVTFQNNECPNLVKDIFSYQSGIFRAWRSCFYSCYRNSLKTKAIFLNQGLKIFDTIEPDQVQW